MKDEQTQSLLEAWFLHTDPTPPDTRQTASQVMAKVPKVRQRGRWWPLSVFGRPASRFPIRELATAPIPATNGRQPVGGSTMFSAVKFVVAGVIVALFGGFLLAGVLTTPQEREAAPAAVNESPSPMTSGELSAPHSATAIFSWAELVEPGEMSEDGLSVRGDSWLGWVYSPDDPRLTGEARIAVNMDGYEVDPYVSQLSWAIRIANDDGAWVGTVRGYRDPESKPNRHLNIELAGEGGYAGHAALLTTPGRGDGWWEGFVFPSPLLGYPDPIEPPAE